MTSTQAIDDTSMLQDYIARSIAIGKALLIPASREYVIRKTLKIPSCEGLEIMGEHLYRSRIVWKGDDLSLFERPNSRDCLFHQFTIDVQGALGCIARDTNLNYPKSDSRHSTLMIIPSSNQHRRLRILGNGKLDFYRRYDIGNCDENNELHSDIDVHVNGSMSGWSINGSQSKYHEMTRCRFNGDVSRGQAAVSALHGSFSWLGGGGSHCAYAFFAIENQADTIALHRASVETCTRYAVIRGPYGQTGVSQPVEIAGGYFMCDQLATDQEAIQMRTAGPLLVRNFQLGDGSQRIPKIAYHADHGTLTVSGNKFGAWGSSPENSVDASDGIFSVIHDNTYHLTSGESYVI